MDEARHDSYRPTIAIIAAMTPDGLIGRDGTLPWPRHARDMKRFARLTKGHAILCGRKTWESLPVRPLKDRLNFVASRRPDFSPVGQAVWRVWEPAHYIQARGGRMLSEAKCDPFVIGGSDLFRLALPLADTVYLTLIDDNFSLGRRDGDTYFPVPLETFAGDPWRLWGSQPWQVADEANPFPMKFLEYRREAR